MPELKVIVTGGESKPPVIVKCRRSVSAEIRDRCKDLTPGTPILLNAQVGSGKTYAIIHVLLPWAIKEGLRILYVSSRLANNTQAKQEIIKETGETHLLDEYTPEGMRRLTDFKSISVITFHRLYRMMLHEPKTLSSFDILVFDEIHALLEDADFVAYTGYILYHIQECFGSKIRIYMSGTPEGILPYLARAEAPYQLSVLRFPRNFSYLDPHFFCNKADIVTHINNDKSSHKWLVFVPSIQDGEVLASQLSCPACLLNSKTRADNEEQWTKILDNRAFPEKVAIVTSVVDVGISFEDRSLVNIVTFTTSLTTLVQVLGRKRRKGNERVRLFVWCPTEKGLRLSLRQNYQTMEKFNLLASNPSLFAEQHILRPEGCDLRRFVRANMGGNLNINPLAVAKLSSEINFYKAILGKGSKHCPLNFAKAVANYLLLRGIDYSSCWLNVGYVENPRVSLEGLVAKAVGRQMSAEEFSVFANSFRDLWTAAYGVGPGGRDRKDRPWGEAKIKKKLNELSPQYQLQSDASKGTFWIVDVYSSGQEF